MPPKRPSVSPVPNGIPIAPAGGKDSDFVTSTAMLKEIIEPDIAVINHDLNDNGGRGFGAAETVASRAAQFLPDSTTAAVIRRLHDVRNNNTRSISCGLADAMLLAVDRLIEHTDLPTFPRSRAAAQEMIDAYYEHSDKPAPTPMERKRLARAIYSFGKGFLADNTDGPLPDTEEFARLVARDRVTRYNSVRTMVPELQVSLGRPAVAAESA